MAAHSFAGRWRVIVRSLLAIPLFLLVLDRTALSVADDAMPDDAEEVVTASMHHVEHVALNTKAIKGKIQAISNADSLDKDAKSEIVELYDQTLEKLQSAEHLRTDVERFDATIKGAPEAVETIKKKLSASPDTPARAELPSGVSLTVAEEQLGGKEAELQALEKRIVELTALPEQRRQLRGEFASQMEDLRVELAEARRQLAALPPADTELAEAKRMHLAADEALLVEKIAVREKELASYDATADLVVLERQLAERDRTAVEAELKLFREAVARRRTAEAERQAIDAQQKVSKAHPAVRQFAEENAALAQRRTELTARTEEYTAEIQRVAELKQKVHEQAARVKQRVERAGLTSTIGSLLRAEREDLPDTDLYWRRIRSRKSLVASIQPAVYQLEDYAEELPDAEAALKSVLDGLDPSTLGIERYLIERSGRDLLDQRKQYYKELTTSDYPTLFETISELETLELELIAETDELTAFIDEQVLWIPSSASVRTSTLASAWQALIWLTDPGEWQNIARRWSASTLKAPLWLIAAMGVFGLLWSTKHRLRRRLAEISETTRKGSCDKFAPTLEVLAFTVLMAAPWPAALGLVGWQLALLGDASPLAAAVGFGVETTAFIAFVLEFWRQVFRRNGLADAHFDWPQRSLRLLRHHMRWLMLAGLPAVLVVATLESQASAEWRDSLGRLAFMSGLLVLSLSLFRLLDPRRGALNETLAFNKQSWLNRTRYLWYPAGTLAPASLACLAAAGYYYTALELTVRLFATLCLGLDLIVLHSLFMRWLLVTRRRLAMKLARERRAAALAEAAEDGDAADEGIACAIEEQQLDLTTVSLQTRQLLRSFTAVASALAVWAIWVDVLPALQVLNEVTVWIAQPDVKITLGNVMLATVIAGLTIIAAKNVPGLLEITVLERLPFEAGSRYAIVTICRYAITVLGIILAGEQVGIAWSNVQWLVAAMTVGLGFGLQEIFANFVCGLIILFERPIRVGDHVNVGEIEGKVTRIRIRATTITDWDRRELVVPNKEFVTSRLINWTLSDPVSRVVISVGIAYGSDTALARELLLKVARENPLLIDDPPPAAIFKSFGESCLEFELRVFVPNRDRWPEVVHSLNSRIDEEFRRARIEIAFPQRDLHIRSISQPLAVAASGGSSDEHSGNGRAKVA